MPGTARHSPARSGAGEHVPTQPGPAQPQPLALRGACGYKG